MRVDHRSGRVSSYYADQILLKRKYCNGNGEVRKILGKVKVKGLDYRMVKYRIIEALKHEKVGTVGLATPTQFASWARLEV